MTENLLTKYKQATDKDDLCVATMGLGVRKVGSFQERRCEWERRILTKSCCGLFPLVHFDEAGTLNVLIYKKKKKKKKNLHYMIYV